MYVAGVALGLNHALHVGGCHRASTKLVVSLEAALEFMNRLRLNYICCFDTSTSLSTSRLLWLLSSSSCRLIVIIGEVGCVLILVAATALTLLGWEQSDSNDLVEPEPVQAVTMRDHVTEV